MSTVTTVAGVLCTRVRLEEKRLIDALGSLSVNVKSLPPSDSPLPIQPLSASAVSGESTVETLRVVIDRLQDRLTASVWLPYWRTPGREMIDAGVAATLDRLAIARLLAEAGLPRPETALVISQSSGLNAIELFEGRGTLLPLRSGSSELPLLDREIAEAVLEHREVLGQTVDTISIMQQGVTTTGNRTVVIVVDGQAIAVEGNCGEIWSVQRIAGLAEEAARLLGARLIGVTIAEIDGRLVIWDFDPVPSWRDSTPIGDQSVEQATAQLTAKFMGATANVRSTDSGPRFHLEEVDDHVTLSA